MDSRPTAGVLAAALAAAAACATTRTIPNTKIEDTPAHRAILGTLEDYRRALEARDVARLLAMAHPTYFEDGGTATAQDDYDYEGLKQVLRGKLDKVKQLRYGLAYRRIHHRDGRADVYVFIDASFRMEVEGKEVWRRVTEDNKFELIHDGKAWRFVAGM